jgi:ZipA, C-terminal FtsZ-binding domain
MRPGIAPSSKITGRRLSPQGGHLKVQSAIARRCIALEFQRRQTSGGRMAWWKKPVVWWKMAQEHLDHRDGNDSRSSDLYVATSSEADARAEIALPGTGSIPRILTLVPPPLDPELSRSADNDVPRDYGPDPIAEYGLAVPARAAFPLARLSSAILTPELARYFALPTLYVRTPEGRVTYMVSTDAPKQATEIIAGWKLGAEDKHLVQNIGIGAQGLAGWLATRPERFAVVEPDVAAIAARHQVARRIIEIKPNDVAIMALPRQSRQRFDGKKVWHTLHALGLRWGDMDQFQWPDPADQTDYLFWAEVDDGRVGYALPEEIAAGRQHFRGLSFTFNIARSPHGPHVLKEMVRAAEAFAKELDCRLAFMIDRAPAHGLRELEVAVRAVGAKLRACGVKPGSRPVCMLR